MNSVAIILLLCAILNFALALYVVSRRHSTQLHFIFFVVVIAIGMWNLTNFGVSLEATEAWVTLAGRLAYACGTLVAICFLVFTWFFPENCDKSRNIPARVVVLCAGGITFALCLTDLVQRGILFTENGKQPIFGPAYPLQVLVVMTCVLWGSFNLYRSRMITPSGKERMQLNYILTGFSCAFCIAIVGQFALPLFKLPSGWYLVFGSVSALTFTSMTTYAVVRYRLLDIGVAFRKVLIHALTGGILIVVMLTPFMLEHLLDGLDRPTLTFIVLLITVVIVYRLTSLERWVTEFVDRRIFRGRYDHETALIKFSQHFRTLHSHEDIATIIAREIPIILQSAGGSVYLHNKQDHSCRMTACDRFAAEEIIDHFDNEHPLVTELQLHDVILVREEIMYGFTFVRQRQEVLDLFQQTKSEVAVLLGRPGKLFGVLFLGEKTEDNAYTTDDLDLLHALVGQVETALENTRLYEEILTSKQQYETILGHMQRGVISVDSNMEVVTLNHCAAEVLGYANPASTPRNLEELSKDFGEIVRKTFESGRNQSPFELKLRRNGNAIPCECETSVLADSRNSLSGVVLVFQDLTERKKFEEEVRRMDRLASVGTLAAGIAHEIKNPLVSIQTFTQLLPERYKDASFRENFGGVVHNEIQRINRLIHSLLDFARPKKAETGELYLPDIIDRAATLLENQLERAEIQLNVRMPEDLPPITADPEQLYQVIFNLLQNAMQAIDGEERQITVSAERIRDWFGPSGRNVVLLKVKDTGQGIAKKELENIFDPFYSTKENGSGLGLSICHSILEEHHASIDVQSVLGKGTTFNIKLPAAAPAKKRETVMQLAEKG